METLITAMSNCAISSKKLINSSESEDEYEVISIKGTAERNETSQTIPSDNNLLSNRIGGNSNFTSQSNDVTLLSNRIGGNSNLTSQSNDVTFLSNRIGGNSNLTSAVDNTNVVNQPTNKGGRSKANFKRQNGPSVEESKARSSVETKEDQAPKQRRTKKAGPNRSVTWQHTSNTPP
jgi:hypothetical protein